MTWLLGLWSKLKLWALALVAVVAAVGSAWLFGRSKGRATQKASDDAAQAQAAVIVAQQKAHTVEVSSATREKVQQLPAAPAQPVATADPATAAGQLQNNWRDPDAP
jgi:hypothetical protein